MCMVEMAIFNIQRAITLKVGKQELRFMCFACHLMVFNICVKFHENASMTFRRKPIRRHDVEYDNLSMQHIVKYDIWSK